MVLKWLALAVSAACAPAVVLYAVWRRDVRRRLSERRLSVKVERRKSRQLSAAAPNGGGLLSFLELDQGVATAPPLANLRLASLGSYFASLSPRGAFCVERAIVSAADKHGFAAVLPLAMFLPPQWRKDNEMLALLRSFPSLAAGRFGASALSTLDLVAFGYTVHQFTSRQQRAQALQFQEELSGPADLELRQKAEKAARLENLRQKKMVDEELAAPGGDAATRVAKATLAQPVGPLDILRQGSRAHALGTSLLELANPLLLAPNHVATLLGLAPGAQAPDAPHPSSPPPPPMSRLLPDLCIGNGGLLLTHTAAGAAQCHLMAAVANRLTANGLQGLACAAHILKESGSPQPFMVQLDEGGPAIDTLEGLLQALEDKGHEVRLRLVSNLTSFGCGVCVKEEDGGYVHVPIAIPLRTGLWACDEAGQQVDVLTLMSHASLVLNVSGSMLDFDLEWCLSVDGFTGWLPYSFYSREWATAPEFQMDHPLGAADSGGSDATPLASEAGRSRLIRLLTTASCVLNTAGHRDRLLYGGYGYLGVCLDSAAAIQCAMIGRTTLYPLILGGESKMGLLNMYQRAAESGWCYGPEAIALQAAILKLPCDALVEPRQAADAAQRALCSMPERSVFAAVPRCRQLLAAAKRSAERLAKEIDL